MLIFVLQESTAGKGKKRKKKEALLIRFHLFLSMWPSRVASPFSHPTPEHFCFMKAWVSTAGCGAAWHGGARCAGRSCCPHTGGAAAMGSPWCQHEVRELARPRAASSSPVHLPDSWRGNTTPAIFRGKHS